MTARRCLIVNADDFGQSRGVNRGVMQAHENGIVTSASLMVRWAAAGEAAAYGRQRPELSLGLHFDLGEWAYRNAAWTPIYEVAPTDDRAAIFAEAERQVAAFRRLVGRDPTHLDSHQHVHREQPVQSVLADLADRVGVPLRDHSPEVRYRGNFYGQSRRGEPVPEAISREALIELLATLPPGFTELGCHPGLGRDLDSMYVSEREQEVKVLCDPRLRAALLAEGIELCSFHALAHSADATL